jgi:extracellular factor (EF) 3-hydroxypalmitic acid methyl ester biosynthesis protein
MQGTVLRLTREAIAFEIYAPLPVLRFSEVLSSFRITISDQSVYSGRAVVSGLVNAGPVTVCEATLGDGWIEFDLFGLSKPGGVVAKSFEAFLNRWQKFYKLLPAYKLVIADLESFLSELRQWLEQVELGVRALPAGDRGQVEKDIIRELMICSAPSLSTLFERFEETAKQVPVELADAHRGFCRRQLHPLLLASPFMHRIFTKPMGYAGDYEMVNMILRDPIEGSSLFAKLLNAFILNQAPAEAHRNRVGYLTKKLIEEASRTAEQNSPCRVFNLGCGPAREVQDFITSSALSNSAQFTLLDADEETLLSTGRVLESTKQKHQRRTSIKLVKKTVHHLLKQIGKPRNPEEVYDFIYCAGLFDYLNDRICKALVSLSYEMLAPGGLLVVTNVDPFNPIRNIMQDIFEWHLIYRTGHELAALADGLPESCSINAKAEHTSSNIFLEVRKPRDKK